MNINSKCPLVSVIICTYNHAKYLPETINSILYQDYPSIEIVVVDDGSTDNTAEVIKLFPDVKYHYKQNEGLAKGRNTGINLCKGDYVLFLDADDWLLPGAIRINAQFLNENTKLAFVSGGHISVDEQNNIKSIYKVKVPENHFKKLLEFNYIGMHATVMYRKWALEFYPFDGNLSGCDDYDSYLGVAAHYPVMHHTQLLAAYRRHDTNMSSNSGYMINTVLNILHKHAEKISEQELIATAKAGIENWKNYYVSKEWKILLNTGLFELGTKIKALKFIHQYNTELVKSYLYGSYRKRRIKIGIRKILSSFFKIKNQNKKLTTQTPAAVYTLLYHRIATEKCDPWSLCVSPENFEEQLKWLKENKKVISLNEFEAIMQNGLLPQNKALLTFDDGYADCFKIAKPLLEKYNLPAIFFLTTQNMEEESHNNYHYWDVLQKIFLEAKNLPSILTIKLFNGTLSIPINENEKAQPSEETISWKVKNKMPFNSRTNEFFKLSLFIGNLKPNDINNVIQQLLKQANQTVQNLLLPEIADKNIVQQLQQQNLINVGVHMVSHPLLPVLSSDEQVNEIRSCKQTLEKITGEKIIAFAYPDGNYETETLPQIKNSGLKFAFTTAKQAITIQSKPLQLGRYYVYNDNFNKIKTLLQQSE